MLKVSKEIISGKGDTATAAARSGNWSGTIRIGALEAALSYSLRFLRNAIIISRLFAGNKGKVEITYNAVLIYCNWDN